VDDAPELLRIDGPDAAARTVLLAHGAGAGMDSEFLVAVVHGLVAASLRVVRFEFPYMAARRHGERRGPDPAPRLCAHFRAIAARFGPPQNLVLAGKSMGGRIATMVADELGVAGVGALGYPFHPPKEPARLRTAHLAALRTPCLILQGERDPFGTRAEVLGYVLSPAISVHWLPDGDHSFGARQKSGHSTAGNLAAAIAALAAFAAACDGPR
jgi:hypothetical protein